MTTRITQSRLCLLASVIAAVPMSIACAESQDVQQDADAGTPGMGGSGGTVSYTGGVSSTGGTTSTGSVSSTGGTTSTGGITSTGGSGTGGTSCGSGQKLCGTTCVSPSPFNGCDGPCVACPAAPTNGQSTCTAGQCDFTCNTGYSKSGSTCVANVTCTDNVKNGSETDVDCGGSTCPKCAPGKVCLVDTDCAKGPCQSGICGCTPATCASANSCATSFDDGCGNTLDCSQTCAASDICYQNTCCAPLTACPATSCDPAQSDGCGSSLDCSANCARGEVCFNLQCCTPQPCGTQCGHPTDGCGTTLNCGLCADGGSCTSNTDCQSGACQTGTCVSCTDGKLNNGETDVDCGGANCPKCASGSTCKADSDCVSNTCCTLLDLLGSCFGDAVGTCK